MKIFNLRFHLEQSTPTEGVVEFNTFTVPDAQVRLNGKLTGFTFFVELESKVFQITQCEDEHIIFFVPPDAKTPEDFTLIYQHNPYDGEWDELPAYLSPDNAKLLRLFWLFCLDNRPVFNHLPSTSIS